jgi:hypothetical protein
MDGAVWLADLMTCRQVRAVQPGVEAHKQRFPGFSGMNSICAGLNLRHYAGSDCGLEPLSTERGLNVLQQRR